MTRCRALLRLSAAWVMLALTACSAPGAGSRADAGPPPLAPDSIEPPMWSDAGLTAQPRLQRFRERLPPDLGYEPGTTPWRLTDLQLPPELTTPDVAPAGTPGELLKVVAVAVGSGAHLGSDVWELTLRVLPLEGDTAIGVLLLWGLADDALLGHDVRVRMSRGARGWYVEGVEERFHCARAVDDQGLCL